MQSTSVLFNPFPYYTAFAFSFAQEDRDSISVRGLKSGTARFCVVFKVDKEAIRDLEIHYLRIKLDRFFQVCNAERNMVDMFGAHGGTSSNPRLSGPFEACPNSRYRPSSI